MEHTKAIENPAESSATMLIPTTKKTTTKLLPSINIRKWPSQKLLMTKIKQHSKLAKLRIQENQTQNAIAQYEKALHAAYDFYNDLKHDEILKIRENIADLHTLEGNHEDALLLYSSVKDSYFAGKLNVGRVKTLETKEVDAMNQVTASRKQKETEQINQLYQLSLVNIQIGNYERAHTLLLKALNRVRIREGITNDQFLNIRMHLGELHEAKLEIEEARTIYRSICVTMMERKEGPNWELYAKVKQKYDNLIDNF